MREKNGDTGSLQIHANRGAESRSGASGHACWRPLLLACGRVGRENGEWLAGLRASLPGPSKHHGLLGARPDEVRAPAAEAEGREPLHPSS